MEGVISAEPGSMECSIWFGNITGQRSSERADSKWCVNRKWNENHTRDSLPFSSDIAGWFGSWLHESYCSIFTRNSCIVWCSTGWNAPRSSTMHSLWSCSFALSTATHSLWTSSTSVTVATRHSTVYYRVHVLQGNHRQCANLKTSRRHVPNGKV